MSLTRDIAIMRRAPVLRRLGDEQLRLLAFGGERVRAHRGEALFEAGEPADCAAIVLAGQVDLALPGGRSFERVTTVGSLIDAPALFVQTRRIFRVVARSETEVLKITGTQMARIMIDSPEMAEPLRADLEASLFDLLGALDAVAARLGAAAAAKLPSRDPGADHTDAAGAKPPALGPKRP